jgi:hypothetical protein
VIPGHFRERLLERLKRFIVAHQEFARRNQRELNANRIRDHFRKLLLLVGND